MKTEKLIQEILSKRTPDGYYLIPADRKGLVAIRTRFSVNFEIEELGDVVVVKVKSRNIAEKITRYLVLKGLVKSL